MLNLKSVQLPATRQVANRVLLGATSPPLFNRVPFDSSDETRTPACRLLRDDK